MIQMPIKKDISSFGFLSLTLLICGVSLIIGMLFTMTGIWNENNFVTATSTAGVEMLPYIVDEGIDATVVVEGLERPTSMAFLGPNDFIVLEKKSGIVKRIVNGSILEPPLLDVKVAKRFTRCCYIKNGYSNCGEFPE
jgi:glucose/arabinose dehydrogenase